MNRSIQSTLATTLLAIGMLGAGAAANASTNVYLSVGAAPVHVRPATVYLPQPRVVQVAPQPVYTAGYGYEGRYEGGYEQERPWQASCSAPRWDPNARYMPGQTVWRHHTLYAARRVSASVWNVNSPPEWTPNYWAAVSCR